MTRRYRMPHLTLDVSAVKTAMDEPSLFDRDTRALEFAFEFAFVVARDSSELARLGFPLAALGDVR